MRDPRYVTTEEWSGLLSAGRAGHHRETGQWGSDTDAVWYLLREAFDTLRLLPSTDESRWLRAGKRISTPAPVRSERDEWIAAVERVVSGMDYTGRGFADLQESLSPPTAAAIARVDLALSLLQFVPPGRQRERNTRVLIALAQGFKPSQVAFQIARGGHRRIGPASITNLRPALCGAIAREVQGLAGLAVQPVPEAVPARCAEPTPVRRRTPLRVVMVEYE